MRHRSIGFLLGLASALTAVGLSQQGAFAGQQRFASASQPRAAAMVRSLSSTTARTPLRVNTSAGYPLTANPPVRHPNETPCVDKLFNPHTPPLQPSGLPVGDFADYADHPFNYTPPANCPGPYASIVFKMHFHVTAGIQFDRTAAVWINATNVFFGTTAEPGPNASPEWTVERDVTEYAPIFAQPSVGQASVYNIVNSQYTGIIYGTAELDFYPATKRAPRKAAADAVYALSAGPDGGYVALNGPSNQMTGTFTFPTNVEAAYLDVFVESQGNDEFWYTCFPNDLAQQLSNCGNTGFREGEVELDGQPAGVVPVYPWIYTGGIDPYLWIPIPGVQTLNFKPYRVDLTPFAAQLDDGLPHTIAVSVYNNDNYFNANAALLVYEDHGSAQVTGRLLSNHTQALPLEKVVEHVTSTPSGGATGKILVSATHRVALNGYVITSHGRVDTSVQQSLAFTNNQKIADTDSEFLQNISQSTIVASQTQTSRGRKSVTTSTQLQYPLSVDYHYFSTGSSTAQQNASIQQGYSENTLLQTGGKTQSASVFNTVRASDTLNFTASGYSPSNGRSYQEYKASGFTGSCWDKTLRSRNYTIVSTKQGC